MEEFPYPRTALRAALEVEQQAATGVTDHGDLTGLGDDDHPQYLNTTRGDARYYTEAEVDSKLAALPAPITDHGALGGLADDDHTQYLNNTRGDARYLQRSNNLTDVGNTTTARTAIGAAATVHTHAAGDTISGTFGTARLGSGSANSTTVLHGDSTWKVPSGGGATNLDALTDVQLATPTNNQVLVFENASQQWRNLAVPLPPIPLSSLSDCGVTSPVNGQILVWSNAFQQWKNQAPTAPPPDEISFMFTADGAAYYVTTTACTISAGQEGGTGSLTYNRAPDNSATFGGNLALPITLASGETLRVTASAVSTFKAVTLVKT